MTGLGPDEAARILQGAGWEKRDGRWWRDGVWVTARGGVIDIKAKIGAAEARAFAALAEQAEPATFTLGELRAEAERIRVSLIRLANEGADVDDLTAAFSDLHAKLLAEDGA